MQLDPTSKWELHTFFGVPYDPTMVSDKKDENFFKQIKHGGKIDELAEKLGIKEEITDEQIGKNFVEGYTVQHGPDPTDKYRWCNHHHELTDHHEIVDFGDGKFVANKAAIPLLKALAEIGLRTRTHHYTGGDQGFFSILLESNVMIEVKSVLESDANRTRYNGKTELLISWDKRKTFDHAMPNYESVIKCAEKDPLI